MADPPARSRPPALVASCAFGLVGLVLIVVGTATASQPVLLAGVAAGVLSLGAALYWRSQLIDAWHEARRRR